jgi:Uma2 family endonuclease
MIAQPQLKMTAEEYSQLPQTTPPSELIDGELIQMPTPFYIHQQIIMNLIVLLQLLRERGHLVVSPADVYFDDYNVLQPDLFWVDQENPYCQLIAGYWRGAPDLVIEVLSKSTSKRDRGVKFKLYEHFGVKEYWIVDPTEQSVQVWQSIEGVFRLFDVLDATQAFTSPLLKQDIQLATIFPIETTEESKLE